MVFEKDSACGNGHITVTAHAASPDKDPRAWEGSGLEDAEPEQQWRVLRFNENTRQSVARVGLYRGRGPALGAADARKPDESVRLVAQPDCLAADYLKTVASAGLPL